MLSMGDLPTLDWDLTRSGHSNPYLNLKMHWFVYLFRQFLCESITKSLLAFDSLWSWTWMSSMLQNLLTTMISATAVANLSMSLLLHCSLLGHLPLYLDLKKHWWAIFYLKDKNLILVPSPTLNWFYHNVYINRPIIIWFKGVLYFWMQDKPKETWMKKIREAGEECWNDLRDLAHDRNWRKEFIEALCIPWGATGFG